MLLSYSIRVLGTSTFLLLWKGALRQPSCSSLRRSPCFACEKTSFLPLRVPDRFSLFSHSSTEALSAGIILHGLGGIGGVIHLHHGSVAHGILGVFEVAAREVDVFDVTHDC